MSDRASSGDSTERPEGDPLAEIREGFLAWLDAEIAAIETLTRRLEKGEGDRRRLLSAIYKSSHEIKGLGTSFGYPELTEMGASLCLYLKHLGGASPDHPLILDHARAMRQCLKRGGDLEALVTALGQRVARHLP